MDTILLWWWLLLLAANRAVRLASLQFDVARFVSIFQLDLDFGGGLLEATLGRLYFMLRLVVIWTLLLRGGGLVATLGILGDLFNIIDEVLWTCVVGLHAIGWSFGHLVSAERWWVLSRCFRVKKFLGRHRCRAFGFRGGGGCRLQSNCTVTHDLVFLWRLLVSVGLNILDCFPLRVRWQDRYFLIRGRIAT